MATFPCERGDYLDLSHQRTFSLSRTGTPVSSLLLLQSSCNREWDSFSPYFASLDMLLSFKIDYTSCDRILSINYFKILSILFILSA